MYFTVYSDIVYHGGRVYGHDGDYGLSNMASRVDGRLGDMAGFLGSQMQ